MENIKNVKATRLEIFNTMKLEAVTVDLTKNALTIIGGKNEAGKSTVGMIFALLAGGNKYKPSKLQSKYTDKLPHDKLYFDNGLSVELKGKNNTLTVSGEHGALKSGQSLLNAFIGELALDLPKFMSSTNTEKAKILLGLLGVGKELKEFNDQETELVNDRKYYKKEHTIKESQFKGMVFYDNAPGELKTMDSLLKKQDDIIAKNRKNDKIRNEYNIFLDLLIEERAEAGRVEHKIADTEQILKEMKADLSELQNTLSYNEEKQKSKLKTVNELKEYDAEPIKQGMQQLESENNKVRQNQKFTEAEKDLAKSVRKVNKFTTDLDKVRASKKALLDGAKLPLSGLSIEDGELVYKGDKWDCMASSSQLMVSVAIVKSLYPKCGFVLMDGLEQFDEEQLQIFGEWLQEQDLQVLGIRVSTGKECSLVIEDGKGSNVKEND